MARPYKFTPEQLQKKVNEYFEYADANPPIKHDVVKTGERAGQVLDIPSPPVYSIQSLCVFLDIHPDTFYDFIHKKRQVEQRLTDEEKADYVENINKLSDIFASAKVKIASNQVDGAAAGHFNPMIVSRLQGLTDKQEVTTATIDATDKSEEEIQAAIAAIEAARKK